MANEGSKLDLVDGSGGACGSMRPSRPRSPLPRQASARACLVLAGALSLCSLSFPATVRAEELVLEGAPNLYGQTGVLRTTSARTMGNLVLDVGASGFGSAAGDFIVPDAADFDAFLGGYLTLSAAFLDVFEVSLASRAASNANTARGASQFSVGDLYPSFKMGFAFVPVAVGIDVRGHLPTRIDRAGFDLDNWAVATQGLVTLDLHDGMDIPLRAHLNAGYVFQGGKYLHGDGFFEDNPNFYNGVDGQLLALAAEAWFYDSVTAGLSVEAPLPYVTPFVETWYRTAVGVPEGRGAQGGPYDAVGNAHLTLSPGARVTVLPGITFDAAVDLGVLGTGDGGKDITKLVDGTPPNPSWVARFGVTGTFDPFASRGASAPGSTRAPDAVVVVDHRGAPAPASADAPAGARPAPGQVMGWVTNKEDEVVEGDLEVWDAMGVRAAGRSVGGAFDLIAAAGPVAVVAKPAGYLAQGAAAVLEPGGRTRLGIVLKKAPKARKVTLERERIAHSAKIPFEFKKARLQSTAEYILDEVVDVMLRNPSVRVRIDVYAEALATPEESQRLADDRAREVADYLVSRGVWPSRLETRGVPLAPSDTEKKRRVELIVVP